MSTGLRRRLAALTCRVLNGVLPPHLRSWGQAVLHEVAGIDDDTDALLFAAASLSGLIPVVIACHLRGLFIPPATIIMGFHDAAVRRPRSAGVMCAIGSAVLGLAYMAMAGAPMRYLGVNAGALAVGLAMLVAIGRMEGGVRRWPGATTLAMGVALLAATLLGDRIEGAARWVRVGGLFIQPSLVLLPVMVVGFARARDLLSAAGMIVAAAALAIQPDRAMAGMLAAGLAILVVMRPDRLTIPAFVSGILSFAITLVRADTLPAVPYVDRILYSAFSVHVLAGLAVSAGAVLLVLPAIAGTRCDADDRAVHLVFGMVWLATIAAAALGNYPTPMVGYGGSAVLGYVLSLTMLPRMARARPVSPITRRDEAEADRRFDRHPRIALACPA